MAQGLLEIGAGARRSHLRANSPNAALATFVQARLEIAQYPAARMGVPKIWLDVRDGTVSSDLCGTMGHGGAVEIGDDRSSGYQFRNRRTGGS